MKRKEFSLETPEIVEKKSFVQIFLKKFTTSLFAKIVTGLYLVLAILASFIESDKGSSGFMSVDLGRLLKAAIYLPYTLFKYMLDSQFSLATPVDCLVPIIFSVICIYIFLVLLHTIIAKIFQKSATK